MTEHAYQRETIAPRADGVPDTDPHGTLRADIRRLGDLLGETLVRQEGPELLDLVERVRGSPARTDRAAEAARRPHLETAAKLVRAFSTYFHLANVTEQVHRGRAMRQRTRRRGRLLARTADRSRTPTRDAPAPRRPSTSTYAPSSPPTPPRPPAAPS